MPQISPDLELGVCKARAPSLVLLVGYGSPLPLRFAEVALPPSARCFFPPGKCHEIIWNSWIKQEIKKDGFNQIAPSSLVQVFLHVFSMCHLMLWLILVHLFFSFHFASALLLPAASEDWATAYAARPCPPATWNKSSNPALRSFVSDKKNQELVA